MRSPESCSTLYRTTEDRSSPRGLSRISDSPAATRPHHHTSTSTPSPLIPTANASTHACSARPTPLAHRPASLATPAPPCHAIHPPQTTTNPQRLPGHPRPERRVQGHQALRLRGQVGRTFFIPDGLHLCVNNTGKRKKIDRETVEKRVKMS